MGMNRMDSKILKARIETGPSFSIRTAYICSVLSQYSYIKFEKRKSNEQKLIDLLASSGFRLLDTLNEGGTQAIVVEGHGMRTIAVRGTDGSYEDIKNDLDCEEHNFMHEGFYEAYSFIHRPCLDYVASAALPVYLTGHSLGGDVVSIASSQIPSQQITGVYTFGAAKAYTKGALSRNFPPIYRIENYYDPVPFLPPRSKWKKVGSLHYIDRKGRLIANYDDSKRWLGLFTRSIFSGRKTFKYHDKAKYVKHMKNNALAAIGS